MRDSLLPCGDTRQLHSGFYCDHYDCCECNSQLNGFHSLVTFSLGSGARLMLYRLLVEEHSWWRNTPGLTRACDTGWQTQVFPQFLSYLCVLSQIKEFMKVIHKINSSRCALTWNMYSLYGTVRFTMLIKAHQIHGPICNSQVSPQSRPDHFLWASWTSCVRWWNPSHSGSSPPGWRCCTSCAGSRLSVWSHPWLASMSECCRTHSHRGIYIPESWNVSLPG